MRTKHLYLTLSVLILLLSSMLLLCSCSYGSAGKEVDEPGEEVDVGVVKLTIGDKIFIKSAEYETLHELLIHMAEVGDISEYEYDQFDGMFYAKRIDTLQDTDTQGIMIYHNIEDDNLYSSNLMKRVGGVTFRRANVGTNYLPTNAPCEYIILLENY